MSTAWDDFSTENSVNNGFGGRHRLMRLKCSDPNFAKVGQLFEQGWQHPKKCRPEVHAIFKVVMLGSELKPYLNYREIVDREIAPMFMKLDPNAPGNEMLLFHGTTRTCLLGEEPDNIILCLDPDCSLCCILRNSFDTAKCGTKNNFKRFGYGIYTSKCSSKADDYSINKYQGAELRTMIVSRVVVGRTYTRYWNARDLVAPPKDYHSVTGKPGWDLNYEETVCYNNDAIRPAYVVVYGTPPKSDSTVRAVWLKLLQTPLAQ